jgi:hypothetical protein
MKILLWILVLSFMGCDQKREENDQQAETPTPVVAEDQKYEISGFSFDESNDVTVHTNTSMNLILEKSEDFSAQLNEAMDLFENCLNFTVSENESDRISETEIRLANLSSLKCAEASFMAGPTFSAKAVSSRDDGSLLVEQRNGKYLVIESTSVDLGIDLKELGQLAQRCKEISTDAAAGQYDEELAETWKYSGIYEVECQLK